MASETEELLSDVDKEGASSDRFSAFFSKMHKTKGKNMAKNPPIGDGQRIGAVKNRSQTLNPQNQRWTKRDTETGRFIDQKADHDPFKGVRKEK